jgi:hypothetical protein
MGLKKRIPQNSIKIPQVFTIFRNKIATCEQRPPHPLLEAEAAQHILAKAFGEGTASLVGQQNRI